MNGKKNNMQTVQAKLTRGFADWLPDEIARRHQFSRGTSAMRPGWTRVISWLIANVVGN